jgi:gamma-glutamyltranspeptidase/glutathione hydrolase
MRLPVVAMFAVACPAVLSPAVVLAGPAVSETGVVATVHPLATDAAVAAVEKGGNAVDAAVAAALTLGVVSNHLSGIGGGCFLLIRLPDGKFVAIDGRETAPAKATKDMFLKDGKPQNPWSKTGPLAVATPGALAALDLAARRYGNLTLKELIEPAADLAERGFPIDADYAGHIRQERDALARFAGTRQVLFRPDGSCPRAGDALKQPDLAHTYRSIARHGPRWFYRGPFAKRVSDWMAANGGVLSAEDFANYRVRIRSPVFSRYRDYQVVGFPPPSSGGVHVAQILNILDHFNLKSLHDEDPSKLVHVVAEAMKLAFADRAFWLGDPDYAKVPRGLVDRQYAARLAKRIDLERATPVAGHGTPPRHTEDLFGQRHTTHIAAADRNGTWVALTATINLPFGSKVIVPGTGVLLNNEMDDFSIQPGVPNAFGLVGAEANAVEPGKRPLSSMSPTIVLKDDQPVMTVGASGGPRIISQSLLTIVRHLDLDMNLLDAVAEPRFHHQWLPDRLKVEREFDSKLIQQLERRGHKIEKLNYVGVTQAIAFDGSSGRFIGVYDPRVEGKAASLGRTKIDP